METGGSLQRELKGSGIRVLAPRDGRWDFTPGLLDPEGKGVAFSDRTCQARLFCSPRGRVRLLEKLLFSAGQTWMVARRNFATVLQKVAQVIGGEQYVPSPAALGQEGGETFSLVLRLVL